MKEPNFEVSMNEYLPLRDVVFNTLRQAILRGELKPGERLMEIQLANKLGVSRTPIREAIRKPVGAVSIKGVKKRVRPGMGRCQGGFCTPRVISLLSKEWGVEPEKIVKYAKGSSLVKGYLK